MARVNVEERLFSKVSRRKAACEAIGCEEHFLVGALVFLWHESQEELRIYGTAEEIRMWCLLPPDSRIVDALVAGKYIDWDDAVGQYKIHGNKKQIESFVNLYSVRKKGGEATKKKWAELTACKNQGVIRGASLKLATLEPGVDQADSRRNAMQCNAMQEETKVSLSSSVSQTPKETPKSPRCDYAGFIRAWNENCDPGRRFTEELPKSLKDHIRARLKQKPDLAHWENCARLMRDSEFMQQSDWATLFWLVKNDTNHIKVSQGNYSGNQTKTLFRRPDARRLPQFELEDKFECTHLTFDEEEKADVTVS